MTTRRPEFPNAPADLHVVAATVDVHRDGRRWLAITWDCGGEYGTSVTDLLQLPAVWPEREGLP